MLIVSGWLRIRPGQRDTYLASCVEVSRAARALRGCIDFHMAADPLEPDRINVFEQWDSSATVEAFRGSGPDDGLQDAILSARIEQHEIASSTLLT